MKNKESDYIQQEGNKSKEGIELEFLAKKQKVHYTSVFPPKEKKKRIHFIFIYLFKTIGIYFFSFSDNEQVLRC